MSQLKKCQIVSVGKRRDGKNRYWCLAHKADATVKYGKRARKCRYAHIPPIASDEILDLNISHYKGGVALWGAVQPIYDTAHQKVNRGIHVHARSSVNAPKEIDATYRSVLLTDDRDSFLKDGYKVTELDAIYHMIASIFGCEVKYVECPLCKFPHLDKDWFSVHAHQRHLCAGCGKQFRDAERGIGNPILKIGRVLGNRTHQIKSAQRSIKIRQVDYPGGIQIWGSHPAVFWTSPRNEEEGIHIHAFSEDGSRILIDDTFSNVVIDGISLNIKQVQLFMAQRSLPHIADRITNLQCPKCKEEHFDIGEHAFTPHLQHICTGCGSEFQTKGRMRKAIGNPIVCVLAQLAKTAPRAPQQLKTDFPIEML